MYSSSFCKDKAILLCATLKDLNAMSTVYYVVTQLDVLIFFENPLATVSY